MPATAESPARAPQKVLQQTPEAQPRQRQRRQSIASAAAGSLVEAVEQAGAKVESLLLVLWDELPHWRRDNAYILGGYRTTSNSYRASFASLGYLHNESVNIWSHLLGALAAAGGAAALYRAVSGRYRAASASDAVVFACFFVGAVLCLGMSATYHALSNHSPAVAKWGNKLDYSGIVFLIVGSYVPALYYGFFCRPRLMSFYLGMIFTLGLGCLVASWYEQFRAPRWRAYRAALFVGLGLSGIVPVIHGLQTDGYARLNESMGLSWVLLQGGLYIFGAFLYAIRWPERLSPGSFDIWGSSHQIFHVLILLAVASHLRGMVKAFDFHHSTMGGRC